MLEQLLRLYYAGMSGEVVRTPLPHLFGPPGCGKSTAVQQLADLLGVQLHTLNVSRINPLEVEGMQMPNGDSDSMNLLLGTHWNRLKDGDIVLWDEFLRGFPEVYNGLLDIFTSREVAGYKLPKVFMIGASNSTVAYDPALSDRLLHIPAPDPRKLKGVHNEIVDTIIEAIGLHPDIKKSYAMDNLMSSAVHPMYEMLDQIDGTGVVSSASSTSGQSPRKLIGQAQLRYITTPELKELFDQNNNLAIAQAPQYYLAYSWNGHFKMPPETYIAKIEKVLAAKNLQEKQRFNTLLNLQFITAERKLKGA